MNDTMHMREGWPALMPAEMAARYLSVSEDVLIRLSATYSVAAVELEGNLERWRKRDLERLISKLPLVQTLPGATPSARLVQLEADQIEALANAVAAKLDAAPSSCKAKLVSINEACTMLGLGRTSVYRMISDGRLITTRIGRRTLVTMDSLDELMAAP